ncbi:TetR/AcrR family transcriptional regulator [Paenibacillus sp. NFR01]|uniref:TetR/AcrR family transcriptional regulator n=1 Tax=Paenibacillus sp. NFR01 TaxID=1566279 RepID=UPI0008CF3F49|nr:TetR/AcrR family transcriptional regulator [Paenibacillus sp. NFR01]SEU28292.1 transcriptional regulator, TetR family [Paenibacillus sp. NFR01]
MEPIHQKNPTGPTNKTDPTNPAGPTNRTEPAAPGTQKLSQRHAQKQQTRERLIAAALEMFAGRGFAAVKTADIALAAQVSHGTVFAHFATREQLLEAVIAEFGRRITVRLHELAAEGGSLRAVLAAHLQGIREHEALYTRMIAEAQLLGDGCRNALVMIQSAIAFHILQIAERGMDEGLIRRQPPELLFNTWLGLIHHYLLNGDLFAPGGSVVERYGELLLEHYIGLIGITKGGGLR